MAWSRLRSGEYGEESFMAAGRGHENRRDYRTTVRRFVRVVSPVVSRKK